MASNGDLVETAPDGSGLSTLVSSNGNAIQSFSWSPDGMSWTYLINKASAKEWHLVRNGADRVLASLLHEPAHGGGADITPVMVAFSQAGGYVAVTNMWTGEQSGVGADAPMQIRRIDGTLVATSADSISFNGAISDLLWIGSTLYFRDRSGVKAWDGSTVKSTLSGVNWIRPKLSPDGKLVVFHTVDATRVPRVFTYDVAAGKVRQVSSAGGSEAWFLDSGHVWYEQERRCEPADPCSYDTYINTGKTYVINLASGAETESKITRIADVWPRPGEAAVINLWWMDPELFH